MVIDTEKVICSEDIFDEEAIVLRIEDNAAGRYLAVYSRMGADEQCDQYGIIFENAEHFNKFCKVARAMLKFTGGGK